MFKVPRNAALLQNILDRSIFFIFNFKGSMENQLAFKDLKLAFKLTGTCYDFESNLGRCIPGEWLIVKFWFRDFFNTRFWKETFVCVSLKYIYIFLY